MRQGQGGKIDRWNHPPGATFRLFAAAGLAAWSLGAAIGAADAVRTRGDAVRPLESEVANWPEVSRQAALLIAARYGPPDAVSSAVLTWNDKRPWKSILVYRDDGASSEVLQQSVRCAITAEQRRALSAFGHGLFYDPLNQELSATSDSEEKNILALNLAGEIVRGRGIEQASRAYDRTLELSASGKSSPLTRELLFMNGNRSRRAAKPMTIRD